MKKIYIFALCATLICFLISGRQVTAEEDRGKSTNLLLRVNVNNDIPGPVDLVVQVTDAPGKIIVDEVMTWDANNNIFSTEIIEIPARARVLRFTFINDFFDGTGNPDGDRNAFIDYFTLNHNRYEGEDFDRTGGPDPQFPGCEVTTFPARTAANCGNEGDWVEYDLLRLLPY